MTSTASARDGLRGRAGGASARWESALVWLLALLGAARVLALGSALPFFGPVDEFLHVDLVAKYARGFLPGPEEARFEPRVARWIIDHASPEYIHRPEDMPGGRHPGPEQARAQRPPGSSQERRAIRSFALRVNIEADAPPFYYAVAGAWMGLGERIGFAGLGLLYWLRWLNALVLAAAVWACWGLLRERAPDPWLRLAPVVLVASWPNDVLYGVSPDPASLLLGALCLWALARLREGRAGLPGHAVAGLLLGLAFLNKYPGVVFAAVGTGLGVAALRRARRSEVVRATFLRWSATAVAAALPAGLWLLRNWLVLGDPSGQARKVAQMGWSEQDLAGLWAHPLLGPGGWLEFVPGLVRTFWRGELVWHGRLQHVPWVDTLYVAASLVALALAAAWHLRGVRGGAGAARMRSLEGICGWVLVASVGVLALLSVSFDYGETSATPTRDFPYFVSGRLVAGAWPAFAVLFARGLATGWRAAPPRAAAAGCWLSLAALLAVVAWSEATTLGSAFASPWSLWAALQSPR